MKRVFLWWAFLPVFLTSCTPAYSHNDKVGFGLSTRTHAYGWAVRLGAGWFLDWGTRRWPRDIPLTYWQTIRLSFQGGHPDERDLTLLVRENPGSTWIIGNEPDNPYQDNISPELFARYYHDYYQKIKDIDPTAKVAVGGVTQPSILRMKYLDRMLLQYREAYGMNLPADWWTVHGYVLREQTGSWGAGIPVGMGQDESLGLLIEPEQHGDIEIFKNQIVNFRSWMANNGFKGCPLAITEMGILLPEEFGFSEEVIGQYLETTFSWLNTASDPDVGYPLDEYRLVQRWAWFSLSDPEFPASDLVNLRDSQITRIGLAFSLFTARSQGDNP